LVFGFVFGLGMLTWVANFPLWVWKIGSVLALLAWLVVRLLLAFNRAMTITSDDRN
jgi:hypothetical protein